MNTTLYSQCNFTDLHIKVGVLLIYPFIILKKRLPSGNVELEGKLVIATEFLFQGLGIKYDYWIPHDEFRGKRAWNHMYARIEEDDIQLFLGPTETTDFNYNIGRSLHPFWYSSYSVLASTGISRERSLLTFFYKIDIRVWYLIIPGMMILVTISSICEAFRRHCSLSVKELTHQFWIYLGALFMKGSPRICHSSRGQAILMIWLFSVLVLSNILYSQFQAAITVHENDDYIHTVQEVADRAHLIPLVVETTSFAAFMRVAGLQKYKTLLKRIDKYPEETPISMIELASPLTYQKVKEGKAVLFAPLEITQFMLPLLCFSLSGDRKLYFIEEKVYPHYYSILASRKLPKCVLDKINMRLRILNEGHFATTWLSKTHLEYGKCEMQMINDLPIIALTHLKSTFCLIGFLHTVAFFILLVEILFSKVV